ncbi:MAG: HIT domain-containing protein [Phycisphaerae bacterium]
MDEFRENIWAPWRMEYIHSLAGSDGPGCFLCDYRDHPGDDAANHVVWRTDETIVVMNRFPYTNGHLLIAPCSHKGDLDDVDDREMQCLWWMTRDAKRLLANALGPHGFNIGMNFGRCAGAGLPEHLHIHIVPRWNGDTNFMAVLGDVRVVPQSLDRLWQRLREVSVELSLPGSPDGSEA